MQPEDIYAWEQAPVVSQPKYTLGPRSLVLLVDTGGCRQTTSVTARPTASGVPAIQPEGSVSSITARNPTGWIALRIKSSFVAG